MAQPGIITEFSCNPEWVCNLELFKEDYFVVLNNKRVKLSTKIWPLEKGLKQLLAYGGAPVLICYGLHKLGYDVNKITRDAFKFSRLNIIFPRRSKMKEIQRLLSNGTFALNLDAEIRKIIQEHPDVLGHVNFKITSCSELQETSSNTSVVSDSKSFADSSNSRNLYGDSPTKISDKSEIVADALNKSTRPKSQDNTTQVQDPQFQKSTRSSGKKVIAPSGSSSGQVDESNFTQIRINLNIKHGDCRFEINHQERYVVDIEDRVFELTTAVCENSKYLPQLLATGGSVMVVCYALYKLGYLAGEFSTRCLEFVLEVEPAKLATIRRQITKGRFVESLQDEVVDIIQEHIIALAHLKNFTIQSAKGISMKEMAKQPGLVLEGANLNLKKPVPHFSTYMHRSGLGEPAPKVIKIE